MVGWIGVLYGITLVSFVPSLVLAAFLWLRAGVPLAGSFVKFQLIYLLFLAGLAGAFLAMTFAPGSRSATEVLFDTLFFVFYAALLWYLARFLSELIQKPWGGRWKASMTAVCVGGIAVPLVVHAAVFDGETRAQVLRIALNGGYFTVFLSCVALLFIRAALGRRSLGDDWKRTTLGGALALFIGGIPFFLTDAFWPVLQTPGPIPRGLNVQVVPLVAWNLFFAFRWFRFPVTDQVGPAEGEPALDRLEILTAREREIARLIFQGKSNQEIGELLGVRLGTTKNHIYNIFNKTGASSRKELRTMLSPK